jgi:xanthine dehydrogenase accessory factor
VNAPSAVTSSQPRGGDWLHQLAPDWPAVACRMIERDRDVVRVVVTELRGSAPREAGACLLISKREVIGTIGGGALEWHALQDAHALLAAEQMCSAQSRRIVLAAELGQCCGGVVRLWIERFSVADLPTLRLATRALSEIGIVKLVTRIEGQHVSRSLDRLSRSIRPALRLIETPDGDATLEEHIDARVASVWLYGAGHVGQALVRVLQDLPIRVTWVDSREDLLPRDISDHVRGVCAMEPVATVADAPANARFLILTHDHALDYELVQAILRRGNFASLGLIGSASKAARFRSRLRRDGFSEEVIARLVSPVGIEGIHSKRPAAIAIAIAAQLLQQISAPAEKSAHTDGDCAPEHCSTCTAHRMELP